MVSLQSELQRTHPLLLIISFLLSERLHDCHSGPSMHTMLADVTEAFEQALVAAMWPEAFARSATSLVASVNGDSDR